MHPVRRGGVSLGRGQVHLVAGGLHQFEGIRGGCVGPASS
jgi:hypothetical protein